MPSPEVSWVAHPDVITTAIRCLVAAVGTIGTGLIGCLLYIWHDNKKQTATIVAKIETKVDEFAKTLASLSHNVEHRLSVIETICDECKDRKAA